MADEKRKQKRWVVKQNAHPNCDGTPWGWVEGIDAFNCCWSGRKQREQFKCIATEHNNAIQRLTDLEAKYKDVVEAATRVINESEDDADGGCWIGLRDALDNLDKEGEK